MAPINAFSFFSLISLLSVIPLSFGTVIIKFVAASKNDQEVSAYIKWFSKPVLLISFSIAVAVVALTPFLTQYLNTTNTWAIWIIGL
jgi:hypothetical protein